MARNCASGRKPAGDDHDSLEPLPRQGGYGRADPRIPADVIGAFGPMTTGQSETFDPTEVAWREPCARSATNAFGDRFSTARRLSECLRAPSAIQMPCRIMPASLIMAVTHDVALMWRPGEAHDRLPGVDNDGIVPDSDGPLQGALHANRDHLDQAPPGRRHGTSTGAALRSQTSGSQSRSQFG